jgi:hypothetical protein
MRAGCVSAWLLLLLISVSLASGARKCPAPFPLDPGLCLQLSPQLEPATKQKSQDACCELCAGKHECVGYTFHTTSHVCSIKSAIVLPYTNDSSCVSGIFDMPPGERVSVKHNQSIKQASKKKRCGIEGERWEAMESNNLETFVFSPF